ncbi:MULTISPECIES: hypothetical protein [unclassified Saccharibacter]|uniref:hypothetical protein n=1 Tax=unclassified Saccharibacter TaxID=2648722 RepID=UPI00132131D0|nr:MULTISPECIES: hypothetical protein [unclassified Saccharibacter]MXV36851.1 hypothetical protein [Saccharibacter sp. EH611]MXV58659.1 hypothetical protein [Saccharibacter sp. EH70]MXV66165.1 hypothetical protein [Saccharibacter sp. EH60]
MNRPSLIKERDGFFVVSAFFSIDRKLAYLQTRTQHILKIHYVEHDHNSIVSSYSHGQPNKKYLLHIKKTKEALKDIDKPIL